MPKMLEAYRHKRVGETVVATNGQKMTITEYNGSNDITVKFEDDTEVKHKAYKQFIKGEIRNPNVAVHTYAKQTERKTENRIGETTTNTNGLMMTIIAYENAHNVDVRFENGIIVLKKNYFHFKNGQIKMPVFFPNGIHIKDFAYRIDDDWYYICEHDDWTEEKILPVKEICPEPIMTNKNKSDRRDIYGSLVNRTSVASNGMKMTCIADNGSKDITVRFEDGAIQEHQRRESFLSGHIKHPSKPKTITKRCVDKHIGEVWYDKFGRKMTIVEYYSNSNVTIEYEDGTRLANKEYRIIKKGANLYPTTHVGESKIARNGLKMTIINDDNWNNLSIQFEDGHIAVGVTYAQFQSRAVKHPLHDAHKIRQTKQREARMGDERRMKNGMVAKVVEYRNASDVDYLFENGVLVVHRDWCSFEGHKLGMPRYAGKIFIKEFAYRLGDDWYYIVCHPEWTSDKIMSVKEMYEHENVTHFSIKRQDD